MNADEIVNHRTDMSQYLFHWTDRDHFWDIIQSGFLIATSATRNVSSGAFSTIRGNKRAVCFSEMPVGNYLQSTVVDPSRYRRWGIAIPKKILYAYGARPVLYSDERFYNHLQSIQPKTEGDKYRFLFSCYSPIKAPDWMHEREWRVLPNLDLNEKIGLKGNIFEHSVNGEKKEISGKFLVPIHLPQLDQGNLSDPLIQKPQYVIFVEADEDIEKVKFPLLPLVAKGLAKYYAAIAQYRDKYLASLDQAQVISFDSVKNKRDRMNFWRVEDFIKNPSDISQSQISILWNNATVQTRRCVLRIIGASEKGYEYYQWRDLLHSEKDAIITRIEESEQAVRLLKNDVMEWVRSFLDID